jgi:hypothetical protein
MDCRCGDSSVNFLNGLGYNPVRVPRANLQPFYLLNRFGSALKVLGSLLDLFATSNTTKPVINLNTPAVDINGKQSNAIEVDFGQKLLAQLLEVLGAPSLGLNFAYKNATHVEFAYQHVLRDSIDMTQAT